MSPRFPITGRSLGFALSLVWRAAPGWTVANVALVAVQGVLPLVWLYAIRRFVDVVASGMASPRAAPPLDGVLIWAVAAAGAGVLAAVARSVHEVASEALTLVVTDSVADLVQAQSAAVDLACYENPAYHDIVYRVQALALFRPARVLSGLLQVGQNALAVIAVCAFLMTLDWRLLVLLLPAVIPAGLARGLCARRLHHLARTQSEDERRAWYFHSVLTDQENASELRLFDLGAWFRTRFSDLRRRLREARVRLLARRSAADAVGEVIAASAVVAALALIAHDTLAGRLTVGALVVACQGFQMAIGNLHSGARSAAQFYEDALFLEDLRTFLGIVPSIRPPERPVRVHSPVRDAVVFDDVSFRYSEGGAAALDHVSLRIGIGEVVALAGPNGCGKSTVVRLLSRLYDPTSGRIAVDGVDLRDLDPRDWREQVTVLFQDFVRYQLAVNENIAPGVIRTDGLAKRVVAAASAAGANTVIDQLPNSYDSLLGTWFEGGRDLSTGEWQRIALARALFRQASVLVLDEPAAHLDPQAQADLLRRFRRLASDKAVLLVSHYLPAIAVADRVYEMRAGRIVAECRGEEFVSGHWPFEMERRG